MITEQQFLDAIEIVQKYQFQISQIISEISPEISPRKTLISDWIAKQYGKLNDDKIEKKLFSCLEYYSNKYCVDYIEDVNIRDLRRVIGVGKMTLDKFFELTKSVSFTNF